VRLALMVTVLCSLSYGFPHRDFSKRHYNKDGIGNPSAIQSSQTKSDLIQRLLQLQNTLSLLLKAVNNVADTEIFSVQLGSNTASHIRTEQKRDQRSLCIWKVCPPSPMEVSWIQSLPQRTITSPHICWIQHSCHCHSNDTFCLFWGTSY